MAPNEQIGVQKMSNNFNRPEREGSQHPKPLPPGRQGLLFDPGTGEALIRFDEPPFRSVFHKRGKLPSQWQGPDDYTCRPAPKTNPISPDKKG
jgi:hypothetical protein